MSGDRTSSKKVQNVQVPSFILPRDAGEERGRGLNGAKRLNRLNVLNLEI
jgi:hypothetical protein